jgi:pimeloyl-ACP methyl ester carboxylesterase
MTMTPVAAPMAEIHPGQFELSVTCAICSCVIHDSRFFSYHARKLREQILRKLIALAVLCVLGCSHRDYSTFKTPHGVQYGETSGHPLVLLLGADIDATLRGDGIIPIGPALEKAGFSVVTLDLPCHGSDAPWRHRHDALGCWRRRIEAGDREIFTRFAAQVSDVIDQLHVTSITAVGISRGGYTALVCAAHDPRITKLALIAPVTDLWRLSEFQGLPRSPALDAPIPHVPTLIRIGKHDTRVGTDAAENFAHHIGATLQLLDIQGHNAPEDGSTVKWIRSH